MMGRPRGDHQLGGVRVANKSLRRFTLRTLSTSSGVVSCRVEDLGGGMGLGHGGWVVAVVRKRASPRSLMRI